MTYCPPAIRTHGTRLNDEEIGILYIGWQAKQSLGSLAKLLNCNIGMYKPGFGALAKAVCALPLALDALKDGAAWLLEAARILEQVGRSGEARDIRINAGNFQNILRFAREGHTEDMLALYASDKS